MSQASSSSQPLFHIQLHRRTVPRDGGRVIEFLVHSRWAVRGSAVPGYPVYARLETGLHLAVMPRGVYQSDNLLADFNDPAAVRYPSNHPARWWNGVPCELGVARMFLTDSRRPAPGQVRRAHQFNLLVRVPLVDPHPVPAQILIGADFLRRFQTASVAVSFSTDMLRQIPGLQPCGAFDIR